MVAEMARMTASVTNVCAICALHVTRSRPNYSAIKGGKIRPNPFALILKAGKNGGHERDSIASRNGRQTETARSARKSFAHAPRVTYS